MTGGKGRKGGLFLGLRILLAGFEEEFEKQVVEGIVEHGGELSKLYDSSCTHVIVSDLPLNDPVCCAARKDGKALVTEMWITDCLETDALVDNTNVLYRPLKDLGGIDGSKKLCICLTGYQGLARKNIMRMVEMMGAKFSKPLIGSQVTHLVCYKFEGEKYELARKTSMVLVNHFWLEDSLSSWTLLPESSYAQSGWEAETLKAQENMVEDSGEDDNVAIEENFIGKRFSSDNVTLTSHAQFLNENNDNLGVDNDLNEGSKSHEKPRHSLTPPARNGNVNNAGPPTDCEVDESDDIRRLEKMSTFSKSSASDFPVDVAAGETANRNGSSVPDVEEDESTHLSVEEGNESDHSCGRSSYEDAKLKTDSLVAEMEMCEPVDAITTTCQKMEMMDFATVHTTRQTANVDHIGLSSEIVFESPGAKCRRRSQFLGKEELPLGKGSPEDEKAKDFADGVLEENVSFDSSPIQQPLPVPGSNAKEEEILAPPEGPGLPVDDHPQEMEVCDPKSRLNAEAPGMEISSNETEHVMRDVQGIQGPSTENSGHVDTDVANVDVQSNNQEVVKTVKTANVKEKKKALRTIVSGNNGRSVTVAQIAQSYNPLRKEKNNQKKKPAVEDKENHVLHEDDQTMQDTAAVKKKTTTTKNNQKKKPAVEDKENHVLHEDDQTMQDTAAVKKKTTTTKKTTEIRKASGSEYSKMCFAVGGSTDERTKLHSIIKIMGARICKCRHQWRDGATHVVLPGPLRRTEKFLAGAAAGRWILRPEYLEASRKAGKFLEEEPYEWYGEGTNDKGSISLLAPRKWRTSVATSGVGAFNGLRVLFYGECISPPLETMRRAIKAGGGAVLATAPPYTRYLADGVNFAIISPGIPKEDQFVQEFLKHEVACVLSEYLVNLVCHPSLSLEQYVLYATEKAARQHHTDIAKFGIRRPSLERHNIQHNQKAQQGGEAELEDDAITDVCCSVCGRLDDEAVMLLCGDDNGKGCGAGIHIYCCKPPLQKVPDEDWFCSKCK